MKTPPTKYKDILRMVEVDLKALQHSIEEAQSFRIPAQLPDIVKCRTCGQFCTNAKGLKMHQTRHRSSAVPPLAGQLPPTTPPTPLPAPREA